MEKEQTLVPDSHLLFQCFIALCYSHFIFTQRPLWVMSGNTKQYKNKTLANVLAIFYP